MFHLTCLSVTIKELYDSIIISGVGAVLRSDVLSVGILNSLVSVTIESPINEIGPNAFEGLTKVQTVNLPTSLTLIDANAFGACGNLTKIDFSNLDLLTKISTKAFEGCSLDGLILTIPRSVSSIGNRAFSSTLLKGIIFKNANPCDLDEFCFGYSYKLTGTLVLDTTLTIRLYGFIASKVSKIQLGPKVQCIENPWAYTTTVSSIEFLTAEPSLYHTILNNVLYSKDGTKLITYPTAVTTKYTSPPGVTTITQNSFRLALIVEADISSVTTIETMAFAESKIKTVTFANLVSLGHRAFELSSVEGITLPYGFTTLSAAAFNSCVNLTNVHIPASLNSVGGNPFSGCPQLTVYYDSNCPIVNSDSNGILYASQYTKYLFIPWGLKKIIVPAQMTELLSSSFKGMINIEEITFLGRPISMRSELCSGCIRLKSIKIPSSVTTFEGNLFPYCSDLTTVEFETGSRITAIIDHTFWLCSSLTTVIFNDAPIQIIDGWCFGRCYALTTFTYPTTTTYIGESSFMECTSLVSIYLKSQDSVTIHFSCFTGCTNFELIDIDTTKISSMAFQKLAELKKLVLSSKVTEIESLAFSECTSLKTISFENNNVLTKLGSNSFAYCTSLTEITLPGSLLTIDGSVFAGCSSLINVTILNDNKFETKNYLVYEKGCRVLLLCPAGLTEAHVHENNEVLGKMAFFGCLNLNFIYLSSKLKSVSDFCFRSCESLKMLNIPQGITNLGENIFFGCKSLNKISYCGNDDVQITYHPNVSFPENVLVLVNEAYKKPTFLKSIVFRSNSIDDFGCPNYPTNLFSRGKRKEFKGTNLLICLLFPLIKQRHFL